MVKKIEIATTKVWTADQLRGKTIYDVCDDVELLKKIVNSDKPLDKRFRAFVELSSPKAHALMIKKYASMTKNVSLATAIHELMEALHIEDN